VPDFDTEKLRNLYVAMKSLRKRFVTITEMLKATPECGFIELEDALLTAIVQLNLSPDHIEVDSFFASLAKGRSSITRPLPDELFPTVLDAPIELLQEVPPDLLTRPATSSFRRSRNKSAVRSKTNI
jgi:hypothetical protein